MRCGGEAQDNYASQDAETVRQQKKNVIWFVWFVLFIWVNQTNQMNKTNQINQMDQTELPTVALVAMSIVARAVDVWAVKVWLSVDPRATKVEAESHRGVGVEGRGCLHDGGWLCQLALQLGTRGGLAIELIF